MTASGSNGRFGVARGLYVCILGMPLLLGTVLGWALGRGAFLASVVAALVLLAQLVRHARGRDVTPPRIFGALVVAAFSCVVVFGVGVVLMRAQQFRRAGTSATIGDTRNVISSQAAYATVNGGFYDRLECLGTPSKCVPGYPAEGTPFLDGLLARTPLEKSGYRRTFRPGPAVDAETIVKAKASATSIRGFAYVSEPLRPDDTGDRALCGDHTGIVCWLARDTRVADVAGTCPADCEPLR